jgi:hypothetical protein
MSKSNTRIDKTCLNCKYVVEKRFCGNCGQENIDTRKTFHHLFIHFFEDLTHYENAFWKTIRNLLFKPSSLTKEYLSGKRMSYLAPVRLYIFISFITFLLIAIIPSSSVIPADTLNQKVSTTETDSISKERKQVETILKKGNLSETEQAFIRKNLLNPADQTSAAEKLQVFSEEEFDSIAKLEGNEKKTPPFLKKYIKKSIKILERYSTQEIIAKLGKSVLNNFPKVLLIYMPIFAFFLWLMHNKKRWYYFDHGIFTLHYFSFLLLVSLLIFLINSFLDLFDTIPVISYLPSIINTVGTIWMFYYFFPAHYRFYENSWGVSLVKSLIFLFINTMIISVLLVFLFLYSFFTIS